MLKQSAMAAVMAGLVLAGTAHGQVQLDPSLTPYKTVSGVSGNVSSVGSDTLNNLMTHWAESFQRFYPNARVQIEDQGQIGTAIAYCELIDCRHLFDVDFATNPLVNAC